MDELKYGVIKEHSDYDLWYEPITDDIDGFVLRDKNGGIVSIFSKDKDDQYKSNYTWDGSGD